MLCYLISVLLYFIALYIKLFVSASLNPQYMVTVQSINATIKFELNNGDWEDL